jgi:SfnB family sulfur acquisition oxidoreductase
MTGSAIDDTDTPPLVAAAAAFTAELAEGASRRDAERILPVAEMKRLRALGLQAVRVPAAYGGPDLAVRDLVRVMMALGAGDPNVAQAIQSHFALIEALRLFGTEDQKRRYFGDIAGGHIITNAMAERGTGVVGEFATRLTRDGGGYRLNGTKFYCTGSLIADQFYVLAHTEEGGRAFVVVPGDRPGLTVVDDWDAMGQRTTASGTVTLENVAVATGEIVPVGALWTERTHFGAVAQVLHAAMDAGIAEAALADAVNYAKTKSRPVPEAGVARAADDPFIIAAIGEMRISASAAAAMVVRAGAAIDAALAIAARDGSPDGVTAALERASIAVAEAKAVSTRAALEVAERMFTVSGASASLSTHNLDRHWRNARTHTIHDPVAYKIKTVGDYVLNGRPPPVGTKF